MREHNQAAQMNQQQKTHVYLEKLMSGCVAITTSAYLVRGIKLLQILQLWFFACVLDPQLTELFESLNLSSRVPSCLTLLPHI